MRPPPRPAKEDYPGLASIIDDVFNGFHREAGRALAEIDKWRQADAVEQAIYDIETETD